MKDTDLKIAFLGDIILNQEYIDIEAKNINPFEAIGKELSRYDLVIGNLESGIICDSQNKLKNRLVLTGLNTLNLLNKIGVNIVTLANNHIYDSLDEGFRLITNFLDRNNILHFGASVDEKKLGIPLEISLKGINVCIYNFVTGDTNPQVPDGSPFYLNKYKYEYIAGDIAKRKSSNDFVIVILHWGAKTEGKFYPSYNEINIAGKLFKLGVDIIVGHHSHTIQPVYSKNNKLLFFSIGNFCWSSKISEKKWERRREGLIPVITLKKGSSVSYDLIPVKNNNHFIEVENKILKELNLRNKKFAVYKYTGLLFFITLYYKFAEPVIYYFTRSDRAFSEKIKRSSFAKLKVLINRMAK